MRVGWRGGQSLLIAIDRLGMTALPGEAKAALVMRICARVHTGFSHARH
jgi:hypothetical protein